MRCSWCIATGSVALDNVAELRALRREIEPGGVCLRAIVRFVGTSEAAQAIARLICACTEQLRRRTGAGIRGSQSGSTVEVWPYYSHDDRLQRCFVFALNPHLPSGPTHAPSLPGRRHPLLLTRSLRAASILQPYSPF